MTTAYRTHYACLGLTVLGILFTATTARGQKHVRVFAKDGSGVVGYKTTPVQPWSGYHVHDPDRPLPPEVSPGELGTQQRAGVAPSDAIALFDGGDLSEWQPSNWIVEDADLVATDELLLTKQVFGDCQLHLEWQAPIEREENPMNQGNSGVQFLGTMEVQIFDSRSLKIYPDGQAAAVYAQTPPLVNACREPGAWQTYDIVFQAPRFDESGELTTPARITMFHNGLLVHLHQEIYGHSPHAGLASYKSIEPRGPIGLMSHHCPVRFRNVWVRPLE